jgi:broad specificity phosphatase PhoE
MHSEFGTSSASDDHVVWAVRHGRSVANEVFARAENPGSEDASVAGRDADVDLSPRGLAQAATLARWARHQNEHDLPELIVCSPYLRTRRTLEVLLAALPEDHPLIQVPVRWDERIRDREMGILELLTPRKIARDHPDEAARRQRVGDYYYRPPGGESLADVGLRVRQVVRELQTSRTKRVLLIGHDATILMLHAVMIGLVDGDLLDWSREHPVPNVSVTCWHERDGLWTLRSYADTTHTTSGETC